MLFVLAAVLSIFGVCGAEHEPVSPNEEDVSGAKTLASIRVGAYSIDFSNRSAFEVISGRNTSLVGEVLFWTAILYLDTTLLAGRRYPTEDPVRIWESIHEHLHRYSPCLSVEGATEIFVDSTATFRGTPGSSDKIAGEIAASIASQVNDAPTQLPLYRIASVLNPCASRYTWRLAAPSAAQRTTLFFDQFTVWNADATFSDLIERHSELSKLFKVDANSEYCFTNTVWVLATCDGFGEDAFYERMLCCDDTSCSWRPAAIPQSLPFYIAACIDVAYLETVNRTMKAADASSSNDQSEIVWLIIAVSSLSFLLVAATAVIVIMRRRALARNAHDVAHSLQLPTDLGSAGHQRESKSYTAQCNGVEGSDTQVPYSGDFASLHRHSTDAGNHSTTGLSRGVAERRSKPDVMQVINNDVFSSELANDRSDAGDVAEHLSSAAARLNDNEAAPSPSAQHSVVDLQGARRQGAVTQHPPLVAEPAADDGPSTSASDPLTTFLTELGQADEDHALTLQRVIGRGTFGVVYQGHWKGLPVAVKRLVLQIHASENVAAHPGLREAKLAMRLCHANIVSTYRVSVRELQSGNGESRGHATRTLVGAIRIEGELAHSYELFLLQELCDGGPLQVAIARGVLHTNGVPQLKSILRMALDIVHGLYALHGHNIIHGDLKPENVLLSTCPARIGSAPEFPYIAKLCDFGLSFAVGSGTHVSNMHVGTPVYVAPEVRSNGHLSKAADMYSFGVVLWELFTSFNACVHTGDGVTQHPNLMHWGSPIGRQAPVSYVLLTVACLSPDRNTRPGVDKALSVLADLYEYVCSGTSREVEDPFTFADSIRLFREVTGTLAAPDSQDELAQWLHYLSSSSHGSQNEQRESAARAALETFGTETRSTGGTRTGTDHTASGSRWQTTFSSSCGTFLSTLSVAGPGVPVLQRAHTAGAQAQPKCCTAPDIRSLQALSQQGSAVRVTGMRPDR